MPLPRRLLIAEDQPGAYHLISRCVRRAYLCGDAAEHRRGWVRDLIRQASEAFAVEVLAYAVMSNHLHVVVRIDPGRGAGWSSQEVAERWAAAHPRMGQTGERVAWSADEIASRSRDADWVATTRKRLHSISWFMKCVKERLARRANRDDHCTGAFWEGRFRSVPLLDAGAVVAAMAYVDLNPIRAGMADRPEASDYTSVQERCQAWPQFRLAGIGRPDAPPREPASWLAPIASVRGPSLRLDDYLTLVDTTGRIVASGKRGAIPAELAPILERLDLDLDGWLACMASGGHFGSGSIGSAAARTREALRRGREWIIEQVAGLYRPCLAATG